jgi:hypothetical protein
LLFREYIKTDLLGTDTLTEGHLQVAARGQEEIQIDSHRLEAPTTVISSVLDRFGIINLMIYHKASSGLLRDMPCIVLGDSDIARTQQHIIHSI